MVCLSMMAVAVAVTEDSDVKDMYLMMLNREIKRVPLDFDHPLNKVWSGYLLTNIIEPPKGVGYQCWETTSEGSPISPVFKTPVELYNWLALNINIGITKDFTANEWELALNDSCPVLNMQTNKLELADKKS